jgi:fructose-specific component phosphotransferase system IIB-like protein
LILAAALPAAAHTFDFSPSSAQQACLAIGNTTYRLARDRADVTVAIDAAVVIPALRLQFVETPEEADFVLVDDGAPPDCRNTINTKNIIIAPAESAADLTVAVTAAPAPADYRLYVRSRWIAPETAAALFAAAHRPLQKVAGRSHRSN